MHLINVLSLELEEFGDGKVPPYAILSHRWGEDELNFKEVRKQRANKLKEGHIKMVGACRIALRDFGMKYLWIDTCCINKTSSAELSEAINSMYRWYQNAVVCIVYLRDVENVSSIPVGEAKHSNSDPSQVSRHQLVPFEVSEWFSRAWTLQELLAPTKVTFYNFEWKWLGDKNTLVDRLHTATTIPSELLIGEKKLADFVIVERMRWASRRRATREEDIAYSLLGIFDINMPLLYGEGGKAFVRLQEEIIKCTSDNTFLFWGIGSDSHNLLAKSPADFDQPQFVKTSSFSHKPILLNNVGLEIELRLLYWDWETYGVEYWVQGMTRCVLLLRKDIVTQTLCRIGTLKVDETEDLEGSWEDRGWRRSIVSRGLLSEHCLSTLRHPMFGGIQIVEDDSSLHLRPYHRAASNAQRLGSWSIDAATGFQQCRFVNRSLRSVARMMLETEYEKLHVDFCIDFDFIPYLYVRPSYDDDRQEIPMDHDITLVKHRRGIDYERSSHIGYSSARVDIGDRTTKKIGYIFRPIIFRQGVEIRTYDEFSIDLSHCVSELRLGSKGMFVTLTPPLHPSYRSENPCWTISSGWTSEII